MGKPCKSAQEKEIHSVVCDQEAVKQYSPSDTRILQKGNATWVGMVYCKYFQEIGKLQISPFCTHLIQECCQGLVVEGECTICFCVVFLQFTRRQGLA